MGSKGKYKNYKIIYHDYEPTIYAVNKKGKVINLKTGHEMKQRLNVNGYYMVRLSFTKYNRSEVLIHRLIATYFIPNPEHKNHVHHIDKNKLNNEINNLIWVTEEEHRKLHENDVNHPFANCENHSRSILSNDQVHLICNAIENNLYTQTELAKMFGVSFQVIAEIKRGLNWLPISSLYDFSNYNKLDWKSTDEETIRSICQDIVANKLKTREIATKYGVNVDVVQRIFRKCSFKDIVKDYDFSNNTKIKRNLSKEQLATLDNLILDGKSNIDICDELGLIKNKLSYLMIYRRKKKIGVL